MEQIDTIIIIKVKLDRKQVEQIDITIIIKVKLHVSSIKESAFNSSQDIEDSKIEQQTNKPYKVRKQLVRYEFEDIKICIAFIE